MSPAGRGPGNDIKEMKMDYVKIPSGEITNLPLIEKATSYSSNPKIILSTGMSTYKDINKANKIFKKNKCDFTILHCVSSYPCKEKDLNLRLIQKLKIKYKCKIGYSGHEAGVSPSIVACLLGAEVIERHITLDRTMWGTDQAASLS